MTKILITGGSGFLGSHLVPHLKSKGFDTAILSRKPEDGISSFHWDVKKQFVDPNAFEHTEAIIHLAGAGISDKRWTKKRKQEIVESRTHSAKLLFETLKRLPKHSIKTYVSASAIGYYGDTGDTWIEEDFRNTDDFLGETCARWEKSALQFEELGIRVVIFRIGLVLAREAGAYPMLSLPVKLFAGAPLGSGRQYMSWIFIDDLVRLFSHALSDNKLKGIYNAVAPGPVTNKEFMKMVGKTLRRPIWPIHVPEFILRLVLGERSDLPLKGQRISSEKIRMTGFEFKHNELEKVLQGLK